MISIKSEREIELMREANKIVAICHQEIKGIIKPGITTNQIDKKVEEIILSHGATPAFKGYGGFPYSICASTNEEVIHGFSNDKPLKNGDIISVDIGTKLKGFHGDSAWTYKVGEVSEEVEMLLEETEKSLYAGLDVIKEGVHLGDVSHAIEEHAKKFNLGIVRQFAGHGIGTELHEEPQILNYGRKGTGPILKAGMTLAIEPMLNLGTHKVRTLKDGWTVVTQDKKYSAHFEHTVLVTKEGYEILTKL